MQKKLESMFDVFEIQGLFKSAKLCGDGNINDTYHVIASGDESDINYIFQRVNTDVFTEPQKLMHNLVKVVDYHKAALEREGVEDLHQRVLTVFKTKEGEDYYTDERGDIWRCHLFINGITHNRISDPAKLYNVSYAFGSFIALLDGIKDDIYDTIPNFHNGKHRLKQFEKAVKEDRAKRAESVRDSIDFVFENASALTFLQDKIELGLIPMRVTHNDTKINNVILDESTGQSLCVIDLDTVMMGSALFDFGDLVRSAANTVNEEDARYYAASLSIDRFEAILDGFCDASAHILTHDEIYHLPDGVKLLTLMLAVRYLTDYLNGDIYFKTKYQDHNLRRCLNHLNLYKSIMAQDGEIRSLVEKHLKNAASS